jgi:anti-anti-sigma factor
VGATRAEVIVHVVGVIDICTEPALGRCLAAQLQPARRLTSLVVDLSSVTYIGVRRLATLLDAATTAHRSVRPLRSAR